MRPKVILIGVVAALLAAMLTPTAGAADRPCRLFPRNSFWYADVSDLPTHPMSDDWIATMGAGRNAHPDFGSGRWNGGPIGIPVTKVGRNQQRSRVSFLYAAESDRQRYPIPANPRIEGGPNATGDRHVLIHQKSRCRLFELFDVDRNANGRWTAGSGVKWNLRSNKLRPDGWTSADASGLPMMPGLVRHWEVARGEITHVIRMTAPVTRRDHVWPATHDAGSTDSATAPPMGAWLRLGDHVDPADFPPQARVVVEALQTHGAIIVDNGSAFYLSGAPSPRWDNDDLRTLRTLTGADFEFVESSRMMVEADSMRVQPPYRG